MSCKRFARKHGLSVSTLYRWSRRSDDSMEDAGAGFAEVHVVGEARRMSIEVEHPSGCVVRLDGAVDEAQLRTVLRVLGAC